MKHKNELRGLIKFGYEKTKVDASTAVMNNSSATDCRNRCNGQCKLPDDCYALLPEIDFRAGFVLPYRRRQERYIRTHTADQFAADFLDIALRRKVTKCTHLRVSESGDFYDQTCVDKWVRIAELLKPYNIVVYAYTCSHDLDFSNRGHLIIVGSGKQYDSQFIPSHNPVQAVEKAKARGENAYLCGSGCGGKCDACGQVGAKIYAKFLNRTRKFTEAQKRKTKAA